MSVGWDITISNYQVFRSNQIRCGSRSLALNVVFIFLHVNEWNLNQHTNPVISIGETQINRQNLKNMIIKNTIGEPTLMIVT